MGGKKSPLSLSTLLSRFPPGTGNVEQPGCRNPGMVPGANGGYSGRLVIQHMWGGLSVSAAVASPDVAGYFRGPRWSYFTPLGCWARSGLFPGPDIAAVNYSQGENHLTEEMPDGMRKFIGLSPVVLPRSDPALFYGAHVEPVFVEHCYSCHGPEKQKGRCGWTVMNCDCAVANMAPW